MIYNSYPCWRVILFATLCIAPSGLCRFLFSTWGGARYTHLPQARMPPGFQPSTPERWSHPTVLDPSRISHVPNNLLDELITHLTRCLPCRRAFSPQLRYDGAILGPSRISHVPHNFLDELITHHTRACSHYRWRQPSKPVARGRVRAADDTPRWPDDAAASL